jgi:hypothetical protein
MVLEGIEKEKRWLGKLPNGLRIGGDLVVNRDRITSHI